MGIDLLALLVVLPLVSIPITAMVPCRHTSWGIAAGVSVGTFVIALYILAMVVDQGVVTYAMGNWAAPVGIEYRVDILNAFILVLVSGTGALIMPFAKRVIEAEIEGKRLPLFYAVYLLCLLGLLGITITNDAFNVYVFLEISSLATYTLVAMGKKRQALVAAFEYLILGTIGATFILIAIGLLYMMTGTLNISDLAERIIPVADSAPVLAAFAFLTIGLALKAALFPLHLWLCGAYTYAPSVISAFLAATATKVAIYLTIRFTFTLFGVQFAFDSLPLGEILLMLSSFAVIAASLTAIYQKNIKRMLAYSSIAQIGYIMMGIGLATEAGLAAAIVHMFNHAIAKAGLFLAMGIVLYRIGSVHLGSLAGLGKTMPWLMGGFIVCGLSLIGIPFTAGFVSKWYLWIAIIERGLWPLLAVLLVSSLLSIIYIWRVVEVMYFKEGTVVIERPVPVGMMVSLWIMAIGSVVFGVYTQFSVEIASAAAQQLLLGGGV